MKNFVNYIRDYTKDKAVCLLGFGREGRSTYRVLAQYCSCKSVTICDLNPIDKNTSGLPESVEVICGKEYQASLSDFDIVFKSPGIVLEREISELECEITSETQVFFECFKEKIVGITGTKGKSTVSSMLYHVLKESGRNCRLAGNIGIPVFDIAEGITEDTVIVCELSCHQLEYMTVSPHISVMLNLYEEHLDHYGTMERYYGAKKNIYLHQGEDDILYCNNEILPNNIAPRIVSVSNSDSTAEVYVENSVIKASSGSVYGIPTDRIKLLGKHNHYNIAVVYDICRNLGLTRDEAEKGICSFNPLAHRLEFTAEIDGVRYYDDSISTACATAIEALKSVPSPGSILIGGMDRGIDYSDLENFLSGFDVEIICMETSGKRIFDEISAKSDFGNPRRVHYVQHLDDAVKLAHEITPKGKSCVLSPAAASYGIFRNFEERGDAFKELVCKLKG